MIRNSNIVNHPLILYRVMRIRVYFWSQMIITNTNLVSHNPTAESLLFNPTNNSRKTALKSQFLNIISKLWRRGGVGVC